MSTPAWLPGLICLADYSGSWGLYEEVIYEVFKNDFLRSSLNYDGLKIVLKRLRPMKGKDATFWHIIEGSSGGGPDLRRCERIGWPKPIINNSRDSEIKIWEEDQQGACRILIYLECAEYLVVLEKRKSYILFWTAYPIKYRGKKEDLLKKYGKYKKKLAPPPSDDDAVAPSARGR